jgi:hypothetical protein
MNKERFTAVLILAIILFFIFYPSLSIGTLKLNVTVESELEVKVVIFELKAYSYDWKPIINEINLTSNKPETLTSLMHTGTYNKIKFKILNASVNLNGSLIPLEISQEEFAIESSFTIRSNSEARVGIELKCDKASLTQHKLNLTVKVYSLI